MTQEKLYEHFQYLVDEEFREKGFISRELIQEIIEKMAYLEGRLEAHMDRNPYAGKPDPVVVVQPVGICDGSGEIPGGKSCPGCRACK